MFTIRRVLISSSVASVFGLWAFRRSRYNRLYASLQDEIIESAQANKVIEISTALRQTGPVEFVYDESDRKLSFSKLRTFADLLKIGLIELIADAKEPVPFSLLVCRQEKFTQQLGQHIAGYLNDPRSGIVFTYVYPEKPAGFDDRLQVALQYLSGEPKWLYSFAQATKLLVDWLNCLANDKSPSAALTVPLQPIELLDSDGSRRCALESVTVSDGSVRSLKSNAPCKQCASAMNWWQPSSWFVATNNPCEHQWTEWKAVHGLRIRRSSEHLVLSGAGDEEEIALECQCRGSCALDGQSDDKQQKEDKEQEFSLRPIRVNSLPTVVVLNSEENQHLI